jgi:hypothetical protein
MNFTDLSRYWSTNLRNRQCQWYQQQFQRLNRLQHLQSWQPLVTKNNVEVKDGSFLQKIVIHAIIDNSHNVLDHKAVSSMSLSLVDDNNRRHRFLRTAIAGTVCVHMLQVRAVLLTNNVAIVVNGITMHALAGVLHDL